MNRKGKGITRRQWLQASSALALAGLVPGELRAQAKEPPAPAKKSGTRLILLGNGGGPRPNKMRAQSSWVVMVNDVPYVVDCGGGVSRQMVMANIPAEVPAVYLHYPPSFRPQPGIRQPDVQCLGHRFQGPDRHLWAASARKDHQPVPGNERLRHQHPHPGRRPVAPQTHDLRPRVQQRGSGHGTTIR